MDDRKEGLKESILHSIIISINNPSLRTKKIKGFQDIELILRVLLFAICIISE